MFIMKNAPTEEGLVEAPLNEYGNQYSFCMFYNNESQVVFADTYPELLEALIPGYMNENENEQEFLRIVSAQKAAAEIQAEILTEVNLHTLNQKERNILTHPKNLTQLSVEWWTSEIPLVVVESAYEPYTTVPRPASSHQKEDNLWRINPIEEEQFLLDLNSIGYVRLLQTIEDSAP